MSKSLFYHNLWYEATCNISETKSNHILFKSCKHCCIQQNIVAFLMVTDYTLGQFKLDYEEYQKLKVMFINPDFSFINIYINSAIRSQWIIKAQNAQIKYSFWASEVCSCTQLIFSHSLKQTIILTFDKLCINLIEFNHFATDFAKNIS
jgi:hypothetical protein